MRTFEELLPLPPYALADGEKGPRLLSGLRALTRHHHERCPEYARVLDVLHPRWAEASRLEDLPYLPVSVFKTHALKSVSAEQVYKVLTSSGTTSSSPSRVTLDRAAAGRQSLALARVMTHELGPRRRPMLVIDSAEQLSSAAFSARKAGIVGLSTFGRDHFYALRADLSVDEEGLRAWLARHAGEPLLAFGFTFMAWTFARALAGRGVDLSSAVLVHGGGWKKLESEAVSRPRFKEAMREAVGVGQVRDFYGMVEQIGSVFLECEQGALHAPLFADVLFRRPGTWERAGRGELGVAQVFSLLPTSYPGHSLLTEDLGMELGLDDCPCGRKGRTFLISGRAPASEPRGCSDTATALGAAS
jgi:hypothetical protein